MKAHIFEQHKSCNPIVEEIYEGIDTKLFDPAVHQDFQIKEFRKKFDVKESQKLLLLVGRLTRWKGQEILLKALKDLNKADYVVMLIGDDQGRLNYKKELGDLANSLNISVHFVESFSPLSLAYAAADIVFSCSTDPEAFGRVTAEALCMGKPFIGTNCGATTELTQHGVFAELVEPGDPSQLKEAIQKILNMSQQELDKKALEARKHIMSEYSLPRMCTQTLQLYERVKGSA
jgi:glycosyltransferase involved in cell wall biosynthesis